jgi:hypothetical protein
MNIRNRLKSSFAAGLPALGLFLVFQACGGSDTATAQQAADPAEGVWEAVITARDCITNAPVGTFRGAQVYHHGGTLSDTNGQPTATRGPGFGTWTRNGSAYTAKFRLYTYDPSTGALSGTLRVTRNFTLSADGNTMTSTNTNSAEDLTGALLRKGCGTDVSTRVN